jgi:hypothetical protein
MKRLGVWWFVLALILTAPLSASAWGTKGHQAVAGIGEDLLTPEARRQVTDLLDPGTTLADISLWADEVRPSRPNTASWHSVNIPRGASGYNAQRDCGQGCVVSAIEQSLRLLQDPTHDKAVRQEALKWVVHFVADLHQPLHAIADDEGGSAVLVQFNGRQTTLHLLWDEDLIDRAYPNTAALQERVLAVLQASNWRAWQAGQPQDWAEETHRVAVEAVYLFPSSREIDERYVEKALPVIHEQLAKAAVRLAWVLNRVLGQN